MKAQHYGNHKRYYTPHHFVFYPIALALLIAGICFSVNRPEERMIWIFLSMLVLLIAWLSFMLRQHYALGVQDRVILLELRYRYFVLTQQRFEPIEAQLSKGQLFALRFAPDEEFVALMERAISEKLPGNEIKQAIVQWKADRMRI